MYDENLSVYGADRIWAQLNDEGIRVARCTIDDVTHTFTADDGGFDVRVDGNATAETTAPDEPGTYAFHCEIHPSMRGDLVVG